MSRHDFASDTGLGMSRDERRAAIARADEERAAMRRSQLDALTSPITSPQERIRLWETLHGLRLPTLVGHKLVRVIAHGTQLSVEEVHREQERRATVSV